MNIEKNEIEAIVNGYHTDPFRLLGPHPEDDTVQISTFIPKAKQVEVEFTNGKKVRLDHLHPGGFFSTAVPLEAYTFPYTYHVVDYHDNQFSLKDPYAFGPQISEVDRHLHGEGNNLRMYDVIGAHLHESDGEQGVLFSVWAPGANRVSVVGNFNNWDGRRHPMRFHPGAGIWELFIPGLGEGELYKFEIKTNYKDYNVVKSDPVGFFSEMRPNTASIVWDINKYEWQDNQWMSDREKRHALDQPISVYEVHLGSWRLKNGWEWLTYIDLIDELIPYVKKLGYTHIELLPVAEHPFDGSWGYQVTGYFAPTSRFGTPDEFMAFVDACHQAEIGIIVDWVPAHFPMDEHGLGFFDGTHLYEHADPRQGAHPDWGTYIFNYGRNEVRQFLISNALFWLEKYHIDGLRVDAVASMLYLDFSRKHGEWIPNRFGGRENIDAIHFLRAFNDKVHEHFPGVLTVAEESTSWPGVTHSTENGGLGFDLKWNMGWMHDSLEYIKNDPIHRAYHQGTLTFSLLYAFSENFLLPFSHDEVVHLKKSMLDKMPGDAWQMFANLRLLYAYQWSHPGKKLLFMGGEIGQWREWSEARALDWFLLDQDVKHSGLQLLVGDLNHLYADKRPLHSTDGSWEGFQWIDYRDNWRSILAYARIDPSTGEKIIVALNFTPTPRHQYRIGVPDAGKYVEIFNSDHIRYAGSHMINEGEYFTEPVNWNDQDQSIMITLPPLGATFLQKVD